MYTKSLRTATQKSDAITAVPKMPMAERTLFDGLLLKKISTNARTIPNPSKGATGSMFRTNRDTFTSATKYRKGGSPDEAVSPMSDIICTGPATFSDIPSTIPRPPNAALKFDGENTPTVRRTIFSAPEKPDATARKNGSGGIFSFIATTPRTPASPDCYAVDILTMKRLGFNTLRKHIKIEAEEF